MKCRGHLHSIEQLPLKVIKHQKLMNKQLNKHTSNGRHNVPDIQETKRGHVTTHIQKLFE